MYSYYKTLESEMADRQHHDERIKSLNDKAEEIRNKSKELVNSSKSMNGKNIHANAANSAIQDINRSKNVAYKRLENRGNRATDSYIITYEKVYI